MGENLPIGIGTYRGVPSQSLWVLSLRWHRQQLGEGRLGSLLWSGDGYVLRNSCSLIKCPRRQDHPTGKQTKQNTRRFAGQTSFIKEADSYGTLSYTGSLHTIAVHGSKLSSLLRVMRRIFRAKMNSSAEYFKLPKLNQWKVRTVWYEKPIKIEQPWQCWCHFFASPVKFILFSLFWCPFFSVILSMPFKVEFCEDMFWAFISLFNSRLTSRAQLSLTRAQNNYLCSLVLLNPPYRP